MCLNCGGHTAHEHGDKSNITYEKVKAAADANGMGVAESLVMLLEAAEDRRDHQAEYETGEHSILRAVQGSTPS